MDTIMSWSVLAEEEHGVSDELKTAIQELEQMISATDTKSELYQLNENSGHTVEVSAEFADLLEQCLAFCDETDGALNIALYPILCAWGFPSKEYRIPDAEELSKLLELTDYSSIQLEEESVFMPEGTAIDMGAVGKGALTDICVDILKQYEVESAYLDLGGNIYVHGAKEDGSAWRIGIQMPYGDVNDFAGILEVTDTSVVTSGTYQRYFEMEGKPYHHILDGSTGAPVENELNSVTIVTREGLKADALSTAYFVMGMEEAIKDWKSRDDVEVIWVTKENKVYYTEGLEDIFTVSEGLDSEMILR